MEKEYPVIIPKFEEYVSENVLFFENMQDVNSTAVFEYFFDDEICKRIVFQTNLYATQKCNSIKLPLKIRLLFYWIKLSNGNEKQPYYRDYWSTVMFYRDEVINNAISLSRFTWFLANLHLNENTTMVG